MHPYSHPRFMLFSLLKCPSTYFNVADSFLLIFQGLAQMFPPLKPTQISSVLPSPMNKPPQIPAAPLSWAPEALFLVLPLTSLPGQCLPSPSAGSEWCSGNKGVMRWSWRAGLAPKDRRRRRHIPGLLLALSPPCCRHAGPIAQWQLIPPSGPSH